MKSSIVWKAYFISISSDSNVPRRWKAHPVENKQTKSLKTHSESIFNKNLILMRFGHEYPKNLPLFPLCLFISPLSPLLTTSFPFRAFCYFPFLLLPFSSRNSIYILSVPFAFQSLSSSSSFVFSCSYFPWTFLLSRIR